MKILKIDTKLNEIQLIPEILDDLWHLEKIIEKKDIIFGKTDRKIKPKKEGEKTIRQTIFVELEVEEVHFQEFSENLKIGGIILSGKPSEFIEIKAHQSIDVKIKDKIKIKKTQIKKWQIERLEKAEKENASSKMLIIVIDDESAELAFVGQFGINKKAEINTKKQGKQYEQEKSKFFDEVLDKIIQLKPEKVLIVGPGFTKDNFKKFIEEKNIKINILSETINSTGKTGFNELIKSGKLDLIEKELQLTKETQIIEEFLEALSKEKGEYGIEEVKKTIEQGNVENLIISETYLLENRDKTEKIMDLAEQFGTNIHIISSKNPQEKTIHNMGGIVGKLRYRKG